MSNKTEQILEKAIQHFRSLSPEAQRKTVDEAAARANSKLYQIPLFVSAFPGTGKSYITKNQNEFPFFEDMTLADSDSSEHSKEDFPNNYINFIVEKSKAVDIQFISSHATVRKELLDRGIPFVQVMPEKELKEEYVQRYIQRGSPPAFIDFITKNWDSFFDDGLCGDPLIFLKSGQYLSDLFSPVIETRFRILF